jgi:hypothetical protein
MPLAREGFVFPFQKSHSAFHSTGLHFLFSRIACGLSLERASFLISTNAFGLLLEKASFFISFKVKLRGAEPIFLWQPVLTYSSAFLECCVPMTTPFDQSGQLL